MGATSAFGMLWRRSSLDCVPRGCPTIVEALKVKGRFSPALDRVAVRLSLERKGETPARGSRETTPAPLDKRLS